MIGKKLRELRKARGWSQSDLADRLHMHHSSIGYWERDHSDPPLGMLRKLALLFGVSTDYLLDLPPREPDAGGEPGQSDGTEGSGASAASRRDGNSSASSPGPAEKT